MNPIAWIVALFVACAALLVGAMAPVDIVRRADMVERVMGQNQIELERLENVLRALTVQYLCLAIEHGFDEWERRTGIRRRFGIQYTQDQLKGFLADAYTKAGQPKEPADE